MRDILAWNPILHAVDWFRSSFFAEYEPHWLDRSYLAIDFEVYLIDEVTEIGDHRFRRKCAEAFRERMQRSDVILVTHNPHTIRQYCDRGAILADGELALYDDISTALGRYHRMVQEGR